MEAIVKIEFKGCRDGEIYPVNFKKGEKIHGDLAKTAIESGNAKAVVEKAKKPLKNKMERPLKNKSGAA